MTCRTKIQYRRTVVTSTIDRILFDATVNRDNVHLLRTELDELIISYGADDEITIAGQYNAGGDNIEDIDFADGSTIGKTELDALPVGQVHGAEGDYAVMAHPAR